ncbi:MAG: EcoAI/FtnUII family type I restriction enzme subunit R [Paracoccaceae bacterium]
MIDHSAISTESDADTRANRIDPVLKALGWGEVDGTSIRREEIAPGRIGAGGRRSNAKSADYFLRYRDQKLAVIEAKRAGIATAEGVGQAKDYAQRLGAPFAYATNGLTWYEIDMNGGEREVDAPPAPDTLWHRVFTTQNAWRDRFGAIPFEIGGGKWQPRYYQHNAINKALEAIAGGRDRILLTLATGTGKTGIAFQLCWKLFHAKWNLGGEPTRRPRILFLADRNILANQAYNSFGTFEDGARIRVDPDMIAKRGHVPKNASIFFTIFQTLTTGGEGSEAFRQYDPDFFDFIIIDECHRGGANSESSWRDILDYFSPAVQLGLTATPKRQDNVDTYAYFGEPVYVYSLKEGIEDGYLTPFRVRQYSSNVDTYTFDGVDQVVIGEVEEGTDFAEKDFNRIVQMKERERHRVRTWLGEVNPADKTLVFCATQAHAALIRDMINQEIRHADPDYCVRVTANDGAIGEAHLERFQQNSKTIPTILTTSQKLSTGVDAKNVRNIVLMRPINSMIEFKQIIGRGTRTFEGKDYFTIYDFVKAHEKFEDEEWDGDPADIILDPPGAPPPAPEPSDGGEGDPPGDPPDPGDPEPGGRRPEMIEINLGNAHIITIAATTFWGPDGKPISAKDFIERMFGELPDLFKDEDELRQLWGDPDTRKALLEQLAERGYDAEILTQIRKAILAEKSDLFDVLAHVAFAVTPETRAERAERGAVRIDEDYDEKLAAFLNYVLGQYVESGVEDLDRSRLPDYLKLKYGTFAEGASELGGVDAVASSYVGFQRHLYS